MKIRRNVALLDNPPANKYNNETNSDLAGIILTLLEVSEIVTHRFQNRRVEYRIKWNGSDFRTFTWLPIKFIPSVVLLQYYAKVISEADLRCSSLPLHQKASILFLLFGEAYENEKDEVVKRYLTVNGLKLPCSCGNIILQRLEELIQSRTIPSIAEIKQLRDSIILENVLVLRQKQLETLKKFECEINAISDNEKYMTVQNIVDLEVLPLDFVYVNNYIPGAGVKIPNDSPIGCECSLEFGCASSNMKPSSKMCCPHSSGTLPAYDENKRVGKNQIVIYECNKKCLCDKSCPNRVVQNGSNLKLEIFRTFNGCGWGVRTREFITMGTFVARYVGEVITYDEAEKRNKEYLFDIDVNYAKDTDLCPYTIDAKKYGNVTRFINHSCSPNLSVFGVFIDCLDPDLHEIAFFASRDIQSGEELSFDYHKLMSCRCGSVNCKSK